MPHKGQADPRQQLDDHLGYGVDSARGLFLLTARREASLAAQATDLICRAFARLTQSSFVSRCRWAASCSARCTTTA